MIFVAHGNHELARDRLGRSGTPAGERVRIR